MAAPLTTNNAVLACSFGASPGKLTTLPNPQVMIEGQPAGVIMDGKPTANIAPFGMCSSLSNPTVASATSAANGVLTPQPCVPNTPAPWAPGVPLVLIGGQPAINVSCKLNCLWGGVITITMPGAKQTLG